MSLVTCQVVAMHEASATITATEDEVLMESLDVLRIISISHKLQSTVVTFEAGSRVAILGVCPHVLNGEEPLGTITTFELLDLLLLQTVHLG